MTDSADSYWGVDPVDCLVEIAVATMDRMNSGKAIGDGEAFTLGKISGIACRIPEVTERLKAHEQA